MLVCFPEAIYKENKMEGMGTSYTESVVRAVLNTMKKRTKRVIILLALLVFAFVFCLLQNKILVVSRYYYESDRVPAEFDGYRIVQISDLHNATFGRDNSRLLEKIAELAPDMVVLTGDLVDSNHTDIETAIAFAQAVAENYPTYYVTGNHEVWLEVKESPGFMEALEQAGVVCLRDEVVEISRGGDSIILAGLRDDSLNSIVLKRVLQDADTGKLTLLLAHEPQYLDVYSKYPVDLVFCGHAHGGQIRLPFVGGVIAPGQGLFPEYTEGMHEQNGTTMVISRGLGNSVAPVRVFNLPEIVCVELHRVP